MIEKLSDPDLGNVVDKVNELIDAWNRHEHDRVTTAGW